MRKKRKGQTQDQNIDSQVDRQVDSQTYRHALNKQREDVSEIYYIGKVEACIR